MPYRTSLLSLLAAAALVLPVQGHDLRPGQRQQPLARPQGTLEATPTPARRKAPGRRGGVFGLVAGGGLGYIGETGGSSSGQGNSYPSGAACGYPAYYPYYQPYYYPYW